MSSAGRLVENANDVSVTLSAEEVETEEAVPESAGERSPSKIFQIDHFLLLVDLFSISDPTSTFESRL